MKTLALSLMLAVAAPALAQDFSEPLPVGDIPRVETLPEQYPDTWIFAHDANFFSLLDGKVVVLDVAAETREYKGMIGAGQFASFLPATTRPELYVAETFYSRRTRGERIDAITIYDTVNLAPIGEILLPGGKRGQVVSLKPSFQFTDGERLGLLFNFTPAASVSVVDFTAREVIGEVDIPGCSLIYPTGKRGFSSLCGNGTMVSFKIDAKGQASDQTVSQKFNDLDNDPLFMKTARIGDMTYFVSFKGQVQPVNFTRDKPVIGKTWPLVTEAEAKAGWRPGGWQILTADKSRLYVLMQPDGAEGSHKNGGSEIWVIDVKKQTRIERFELKTWGISIEATDSDPGYLVVTNADMDLDVYDSKSGQLIRTIGGRAAETPFALHAVR